MGADKTQAITLPSVTRFARIVLGWETTDIDTLIPADPFTAWQRDGGDQKTRDALGQPERAGELSGFLCP